MTTSRVMMSLGAKLFPTVEVVQTTHEKGQSNAINTFKKQDAIVTCGDLGLIEDVQSQ